MPAIDDSHVPAELQVAPRYNLRDHTVFGYPYVNVVIAEPTTYQEASGIPERQHAMSKELAALDCTSTWGLVSLST